MKKLILLSLFLLIGCTKEDIIEPTPEPSDPIVEVPGEPEVPEEQGYISISEQFSDINNTTGYFNSQKYFDAYFSRDYLESLTHYEEHSRFRISGAQVTVLDFNNDNKQDLVGFATSFCNEHPWSFHPGKFIAVSDYKGAHTKIVFDSSFYYGTSLTPGDFNNDGYTDVLASSHDSKQNVFLESENIGGFQNILPTKPKIIDFSSSIPTQHEVGVDQDTHDITSGDVNNDGLIDFIQFPIMVYINGDWEYLEENRPTVSINTGNFTFTSSELVIDLNYRYWHALAYELFDLNNDGALDVIVGKDIGPTKEEYVDIPNYKVEAEIINPLVLWGDNTGNFNLSNSTELVEYSLTNSDRKSSILGFGFTDYDLDGDIDVLVTTTRNEPDGALNTGLYYSTYYLLAYDNLGNKSFEETLLFDYPVDESMTVFTNFNTLKTVDIDGDGDIDIVPSEIANWGSDDYIDGLHWKNENSFFIRSW